MEFKNGNKIVPSLTSRMAEEVIECVYLGYWYEDGHFEPIELVYCDGGGSTGEPSPSGGYGGGGGTSGSGSGSGTTGLTTFQKVEKNIVSDKLDACTKAVLEKLKNLKQSDIAVMLARFNPEGSIIFNLNMITGTVSNPSNIAETTKVLNSSTDVNMVFSQNYINGTGNVSPPTDLSVATTMAHEIIHAYLISRLEEFKSCGAQGIICDFPTVYDAYVQQQIDKDKNKTLTVERHHEIIADDYVYAIASTIQEFHTGEIVTSGFPRQVYLDMAWGGLIDTTIFNKNYPNDPNNKNYKDRERIIARINTEKLGSQYGINSPVGTPCKK